MDYQFRPIRLDDKDLPGQLVLTRLRLAGAGDGEQEEKKGKSTHAIMVAPLGFRYNS